MSLVFVALGSNLDEPERQLQQAVTKLADLPDCELLDCSRVYASRAVGPGEQPDYLNAVVKLATTLPAHDLLDALQAIENAQGRVREIRWGARRLDLDLLLYGEQRIDSPRLQVPHPRLAERGFVLYPLRDVTGANWMLPDGRELDTLVSLCPGDDLEPTAIELKPQG